MAAHNLTQEEQKKAESYIISNFHPLIGYAISNLRKKGRIPDSVEDGDLYEHGVSGLMHAIDTYNPNKGSFASHVINKIHGKIGEHLKPKDVASTDADLIRRTANKDQAEHKQYMHVGGTSGRAISESFGGQMGDSESGGGISGVSTIQSGAGNLSSKMSDQARAELQRKVAQHEARNPVKQAEEVQTIAPPPKVDEKKLVIRRKIDADPGMKSRMEAIDHVKSALPQKEE